MTEAEERELLALESRALDLVTDLARFRIRISKPRVAAETISVSDEQLALPQDLIEIAAAAELAHRPHDTVRLWCRENKIDAGGFSMRIRGRWFVSQKLFVKFLHDRP
jgi:hypothetical protein